MTPERKDEIEALCEQYRPGPRGTFKGVGMLLAAAVPELLARVDELEAALQGIAANTCCDRCQEAALVARAVLEGKP